MEIDSIAKIDESIKRLKNYKTSELQRIYNDYEDDLMYLDIDIKLSRKNKIKMRRAIYFGNELLNIMKMRKKGVQLNLF